MELELSLNSIPNHVESMKEKGLQHIQNKNKSIGLTCYMETGCAHVEHNVR